MSSPALDHEFHEGDPRDPVMLLLHGTGGGPRDLMDLGRQLSPESAVLAPAGPVSENGARRWFRRLAEGVFDHDDVVARTHELADFLLAAREHYELGERRFVAIGFSNGANIAASLLLLRPEVLREAVLFAAMLPLPEPPANDLAGSRVLLANGQQDPMAPLASANELVGALRERGTQVSTSWHPGGHQITPDGVREAIGWLGAGLG
ncbi:alpha/beta hydrolase [Parasphingorhabdus pacifica]